MRIRRRPLLNSLLVFGLAFFVAGSGVVRAAETAPLSGRFYVSEIKGEALVSSGGKIVPLTKKAAFEAAGAAIETKADAAVSIVFSNGMAVSAGPHSRFEVKKFVQEPFAPNRNDLDVEPSATQTSIRLVQGQIGLCTSRMVAGSMMAFTTPHGTVNIRGHKVFIEVNETGTRVLLLEGDVTVAGDGPGDSQILTSGQQAILRKGPNEPTASLTTETPPPDALTEADEQVTLACMARRTVFFETVEPPGGGAPELRPIETVAANLPTRFTISPARLVP